MLAAKALATPATDRFHGVWQAYIRVKLHLRDRQADSNDVNKTFFVKTKARLFTRTTTEQVTIHF